MTYCPGPIARLLLGIWILTLAMPLFAVAQHRKRGASARKSQNPVLSFQFAAGQSALKIPFELSNNLVLVQAQVSDSQPFWFIFDTGANATIIDVQLAKKLKLRTRGKAQGNASGGAIEAELIPGVSLALPGAKVFNQTVAAIPIEFLSPMFGKSLGGIIGYDFIKQFAVEIDYDAKIINLYDPASYQYSGSGDIVPIKFINKKPFVNVKIKLEGRDAVEGTFMIDTGADGAMTVNSPFVQAHRLFKSLTKIKEANLGGAGGAAKSITARVENIQIGRFVINKPLVSFSQATKGSDALANYAGVLGGEIFRRFTLIIDYSRRRIIFEPNTHLPESVEEDMSGIELAAGGEDFKTLVINEIAADSPAAEAGLKAEDELVTIDNRLVSEFGLDKIRQMFKQEGKEYLLGIKRGEQTLQVKIKVRRLI
jgi:predicted aspartyl protease